MIVVLHDVDFRHGEVPIKNIEEFTLDAAYVAPTKHART